MPDVFLPCLNKGDDDDDDLVSTGLPMWLPVRARPGGGGGTHYNGLYGEAPPERGFMLQVYKRVGISQIEVYKRVGKSVI